MVPVVHLCSISCKDHWVLEPGMGRGMAWVSWSLHLRPPTPGFHWLPCQLYVLSMWNQELGLSSFFSFLRVLEWLEEAMHGASGCTLRSRVHDMKIESILLDFEPFWFVVNVNLPLISMPWPCADHSRLARLWDLWGLQFLLCSQEWVLMISVHQWEGSMITSQCPLSNPLLLAPIYSERWAALSDKRNEIAGLHLWGQ